MAYKPLKAKSYFLLEHNTKKFWLLILINDINSWGLFNDKSFWVYDFMHINILVKIFINCFNAVDYQPIPSTYKIKKGW